MALTHPFVTYQEAAQLTGKTVRTIRRKIKDGVIAESQTQRQNGHVTIAVAELERVFGKLRWSAGTCPRGHDRTKRGTGGRTESRWKFWKKRK